MTRAGVLEFLPPDLERFPCLALGLPRARTWRGWPVALNAANELAVEAFLAGTIAFHGDPGGDSGARSRRPTTPWGRRPPLAEVRAADAWARAFAAETIRTLPSSY